MGGWSFFRCAAQREVGEWVVVFKFFSGDGAGTKAGGWSCFGCAREAGRWVGGVLNDLREN